MTVWVLKEELSGEKAILNGKLFHIRKDEHGSAIFIDLETQKPIWITTKIVEVENNDNCRTIKTISGSEYNIIDIASIIPTKPTPPTLEPVQALVPEVIPIAVIDTHTTSRGINYCDGFVKNEFTFNRDISEEEFVTWCMENSYRIHKAEGWWEKYSEITGAGSKWTHTLIDPYKD